MATQPLRGCGPRCMVHKPMTVNAGHLVEGAGRQHGSSALRRHSRLCCGNQQRRPEHRTRGVCDSRAAHATLHQLRTPIFAKAPHRYRAD